MTKTLPLCLTVEQEEKIRLLKKQTGVSLSEIARRALDMYFAQVMPATTGLGLEKKDGE